TSDATEVTDSTYNLNCNIENNTSKNDEIKSHVENSSVSKMHAKIDTDKVQTDTDKKDNSGRNTVINSNVRSAITNNSKTTENVDTTDSKETKSNAVSDLNQNASEEVFKNVNKTTNKIKKTIEFNKIKSNTADEIKSSTKEKNKTE